MLLHLKRTTATAAHCSGANEELSFISSSTNPSSCGTLSPLYGGDFAGFVATFSPEDGALVKVPEHLVPEALMEWGAQPSALEVLVSETTTTTTSIAGPQCGDQNKDGDCIKKNLVTLSRQTTQVMPAVGCGVDNLDTMTKNESHPIQSLNVADDGALVSFDITLRDGITKTETAFSTSSLMGETGRLRVGVIVNYKADIGFTVQKPLEIFMERQISKESSYGTVANQGGLTGSMVNEWLGNLARPPLFFDVPSRIKWQSEGVKILNLPGNVSIATSLDGNQDPWVLEIVYFSENEDGAEQKHKVRRSYHLPKLDNQQALV